MARTRNPVRNTYRWVEAWCLALAVMPRVVDYSRRYYGGGWLHLIRVLPIAAGLNKRSLDGESV